jgi:hypothetical protein
VSHLDAVISTRIGNEQSLGVYSIRTVRPSFSRSITRDRLGRITRYPALPAYRYGSNAPIPLKKSENDPARKSRICAAGGVKDAAMPRGSMKLVAEADR